MKKPLLLSVAFILSIFLAACGGEDFAEQETEPEVEEVSNEVEEGNQSIETEKEAESDIEINAEESESKEMTKKTESDDSSGESSTEKEEEGRESIEDNNKNPEQMIKDVIYEVFDEENDFDGSNSVKEFSFDENSNHLELFVYGKDNLWMIKEGMWMDIAEVLQKLKEEYELINSANFTIVFPLQDQYGNESHDAVMTANFPKDVLDKINFSNFMYENIPNIAEDYWEHPALNN